MANHGKSPNADFVGRVVGDAKNPPETRMLTGWLGDAGEAGFRRLYTDPELTSYVDLPDDAILYTEAIRDAQPAGAAFVWIKRDAAVQQGGTAASRAARFLQGQVQQDFSTPEKAGFRCATQVPCAEPTGFTGQCTKQPDVGGAWPCITALPLCHIEPTGFTGKCTHQPWPNPTQYVGCTVFHCPTNDLTHIPWICNIVASGMPGCGGPGPEEGGGIQQQAAAPREQREGGAEAAAIPATKIPGCGYTKMWGLCETHLLGCGYTKDWGPDCTNIPGCGFTQKWGFECTNIPGCGFTKQWGLCVTQPPKCQVSVQVPCITHDPACNPPQFEAARQPQNFAAAGAGAGAGGLQASAICATAIGCNITLFCPTRFLPLCHFPTRFEPQCFPIPSPFCPVTPGCPIGTIDQRGGGEAFAAAAPGVVATFDCTVTVPPTSPVAQCTHNAPQCPTYCGPACQTPQPDCTKYNCVTQEHFECTGIGTNCTAYVGCPGWTLPGSNCQTTNDCTFGCTQVGTGCTNTPQCFQPVTPAPACMTIDAARAQAFAPAAAAGMQAAPAGGVNLTLLTIPVWNCVAPTPATRCFICPPHHSPLPWFCPPPSPWFCTPPISLGIACTIVQCGPGGGGGGASAVDACPSRFCPPGGGGGEQFFAQAAQAVPGGGGGAGGPIGRTGWLGCTQYGPQCPPSHLLGCTQFGPQCHQTFATVCTQIGQLCRSAVDACPTRICGGGEQFAAQAAPGGAGGPIGVTGWHFCTYFGPNCGATNAATVCTQIACGPGGTAATVCTQFGTHCGSAVDACPTRICGGGGGAEQFGAAPTPYSVQCPSVGCPTLLNCPTYWPNCIPNTTDCPTLGGPPNCNAPQQMAAAAPGRFSTSFINCITQPTPATHCFVCDPFGGAGGGDVQARLSLRTRSPIWCNPHSGLPLDCPFPSLFFVCTAVQCTIVQCFFGQ